MPEVAELRSSCVRVASGRGLEDAISEAMEHFARAGEMELLICSAAGITDTLLPPVQLGVVLPGFTKEAGGED